MNAVYFVIFWTVFENTQSTQTLKIIETSMDVHSKIGENEILYCKTDTT